MQRRMRQLRFKYDISALELSNYADVSSQRLSQIELGTGKETEHMNRLVETAFSRLIEAKRRELTALEADFNRYRNHLLDYVDEGEDL